MQEKKLVWHQSQGRIIDRIVVDRARWESDDLWEAVDSLSSFAALAYREGGLRADEIAPEILWNSQVTHYDVQARHNGHYLFVGNSGWKKDNVAACAIGLAACGAIEVAAIHADLTALVPQIGDDVSASRARYDAFRKTSPLRRDFDALDDRLYAVDQGALLRQRVAWIKSLPGLEILPSEDVPARLEELFSANPLRAQRRAVLLAEERRPSESSARQPRLCLATLEARDRANQTLGRLRRLFKNDPRDVGAMFHIVDDQVIKWPTDQGEDAGWYLVIEPLKGAAALYRHAELISGPKPLNEAARAFFTDLAA